MVHVSKANTAKQMWDTLCGLYEYKEIHSRVTLLTEPLDQSKERYGSRRDYVVAMKAAVERIKFEDVKRKLLGFATVLDNLKSNPNISSGTINGLLPRTW